MPPSQPSTELLLLPGMMCDARLWEPQIEALDDCCDIRVGDICGASTVAEIASAVLEAAPPCFAVAGLSMGGIVALEMWRQAPERIQRMALLDTNHCADAPERFEIRNRQMEDVRNGALYEVLREELKPTYLAAIHQHNTTLLNEVIDMGVRLGPKVFERQTLALRDRCDSSATLPTIDCPTLVLCGDEDRLCPPALHREIAALLPKARLEIVERCGHLSSLEQPAPVNRALRSWLNA